MNAKATMDPKTIDETENAGPRIDYGSVAPGAIQAMMGLEEHVAASGIESSLVHLVKLRASQINGCAYCIDMHTRDARAEGEGEQRLYGVSAWQETPFYSPRERAALAWTEALTRLPETDVPDELYEAVRAHFDEEETVALTMVVIAINGWNRLAVPFRTPVGSYEPSEGSG